MDRIALHDRLLEFCSNVYYQPPSNIQMRYPCIIYSRLPNLKTMANNKTYNKSVAYNILVIDKDPESLIADRLDEELEYCSITQHYIVDNLYHTTLNLYI